MFGQIPADVTLALDDLDRAFPFGLLFDRSGTIQHVGPSLAKLTNSSTLTGKLLFDVLTFKKPRRIDPNLLLQDVLNQRLTCELLGGGNEKSVQLFGIAFDVQSGAEPQVLLALTPGINTRQVVEERGLHLSDFGAADGSADLLPLLAMQTEMLEDSKRKTQRLEAARAEMERLANQDSLTGISNRRALLRQLAMSLHKKPLSVIHIDLDHFKEINDTFGHAAGDAALRHTAEVLRRVCGDNALCARLGGDEFIVALDTLCSSSKLEELAKEIIVELSSSFDFEHEKLNMGASAGLAQSHPKDGLSSDELLHRADLALYETKRTGRGKALLCTPEILTAHTSFQVLSADIRRGLLNDEFEAYLQPQVNIDTGTVVGFEALARWNHPTRGLLMPGSFLDAIERTGLIRELDAAVRRAAFSALSSWDRNGITLPKLSLNVTTHDLLDSRFHETLSWELETHDLNPSRIVLEIVESVLFDSQTSQVLEVCNTLAEMGFELALDDFGTGHASILSLVQIPISIVKIDRAFASGVSVDERKQTLTRSMIEMASSLNLSTLAEGVEDLEDIKVLQELGCQMFQGYYFGKAMSHDNAMTWMTNWLKLTAIERSA